jgi:hypothetical protein
MKTIFTAAIVSTLALSACAPHPDSIAAAPTSGAIYDGLSCARISTEMASVNAQLEPLVAAQEVQANSDAISVGVGVMIFPLWALTAAGGPDYQGQIASLRGQVAALNSAAARGC